MPELEEALRTLCANRGIVMQHLRLQALARHPDTVRVSTQFQLSSLETNAVYFHFLARRALCLAEPSPELLRALREALEMVRSVPSECTQATVVALRKQPQHRVAHAA